jgi:hypothetical protein
VRTGSPIGREGEPIDDVRMIGYGAKRAKTRLGLLVGPFVLLWAHLHSGTWRLVYLD